MNPNRLLQKNGLLVQQNKSLNTSLNMAIHRMRFIEQQLEEHKTLLANALKESGNVSGLALSEKQLQDLLTNATARALSAEKQLEEHKANATARALSAEKQLEEHKSLLSNATARALSAEKNARVENKPVENPPIYITRTRRG